jgi:chaperonin GroES
MKIRPLHDRVIVKRLEEERTTASGIVIPDSATEKPDQGTVQAVGNGYAGQAVKVDGEELLVMREEDIMGIVE